MNRFIILIFTFCVAVNGDKWPMDFGKFYGRVHVGKGMPAAHSMRADFFASKYLQQKLDLGSSFRTQYEELDPIFRNEIVFPIEYVLVSGAIKLTKFVATGFKYMEFEEISVFRHENDIDDSGMNFIAYTPILATKFRFASTYNIFWTQHQVSGRANIFLEHVRLQIQARVHSEPRGDGSGNKFYRVEGLIMTMNVNNIRIIISTKDQLPMTPKEMLDIVKDKILKKVAQAAMKEINLKLDQLLLQ